MKTQSEHTVHIEPDFSFFNGTRQIFHQCQCIERHEVEPGWSGTGEPIRCGSDSSFIVRFPTAHGFNTKHMCERHTNQMIEQATSRGFEIERIS